MTVTQRKSKTFERYMKLANVAYHEGDKKTAYDYWQRAAIKDPYNEDVWLAMLQVLDRKEDREVCLENILVINPMNATARELLNLQNGISDTPEKIPTGDLRSKVPRFRESNGNYTKLEVQDEKRRVYVFALVAIISIVLTIFFIAMTMEGIRASICIYC